MSTIQNATGMQTGLYYSKTLYLITEFKLL